MNHTARNLGLPAARVRNRVARAACFSLLAMGLAVPLTGCHSHWVDATIVNQGPALHVLELDYPSASFGADSLPEGGRYHYRFKILGSGPLTLHFDDATGKSHTAQGPNVTEGEEGSMTVTVGPENYTVTWNARLERK